LSDSWAASERSLEILAFKPGQVGSYPNAKGSVIELNCECRPISVIQVIEPLEMGIANEKKFIIEYELRAVSTEPPSRIRGRVEWASRPWAIGRHATPG
jgi:hypothetical protein